MMDQNEIIIRVHFNRGFRFVSLNINELSVEKFMQAVQSKFRINGDLRVNVILRDNLRTIISPDEFGRIVLKYQNSASFFVDVEYSIIHQDPARLTKEIFAQFFIDNDGGALLDECKESGGLIDASRKRMIQKSMQFLVSIYGNKPTKAQRLMLAGIMVEVFPFLTVELLVNPNGGYLDNALKRLQTNLKKTQTMIQNDNAEVGNATVALDRMDLNDDSTVNGVIGSSQENESVTVIQNRVRFLKNNIPSLQNMNAFVENMTKTLEYRSDMLKNPNLDFRVEFPYFFTYPELLKTDFDLRYPGVNRNAFKNFWESKNANLKEIFNNSYPSLVFSTQWGPEIGNLFILLRLFPAKNKTSSEVFLKAMDKLITFKMVCSTPDQLLDKSNKHPHIIALGMSRVEILHYYIGLEGELIDVPIDYDINDVIDLFYKLHFVFNINFESNVAPMMNFLRYYVYEMVDRKHAPTNRMIEVWHKLHST